jgi:nucleotide-binding universal stress UspA family protein
MYDRLLFPTDGSDGAEAVIDDVLDIAASHDAAVHMLNVADTAHDSVTRVGDEVIDVFEQEGGDIVTAAAASADARSIETETAVVQGAVPATITEYASAAEIDLIVMPTHGRTGLSERLVGSTTERVSRTTTVPVLTLRPNGERLTYPFETLLAPTDGSEPATQAVDVATEIADQETTLHVLSAIDTAAFGGSDTLQQYGTLESETSEVAESAADRARSAGAGDVVEAVEHGPSIPAAIRSYAEEAAADCIVMGTHGRTGLDRILLGSVTEAIVRSADRPVLIVPQDAEGTAGAE